MNLLPTIDENHLYVKDGLPVLSVTQVLTKAGIISTEWLSQYGADRGTALHLATALLDGNELDESSVDSAIKGRLEAYRAFKADTGILITGVEKIVYSAKYGYAGTLDRLAVLNTTPILYDIKGGPAQEWHTLQTAAYMQAAKECGHAIQKRFGLELRDNGTYRLREHKDPMDLARFLQALKQSKEAS